MNVGSFKNYTTGERRIIIFSHFQLKMLLQSKVKSFLLFHAFTKCVIHCLSPRNSLFSSSVYDTIANGKIAIIPDFLTPDETSKLRGDASTLYHQNKFSTDALASYGTSGTFDPAKDRAVLKLQQWKDQSIGDWEIRTRFQNKMGNLREDLSLNLNRPGLLRGDSVSKYGDGSTEISYTRFGPGAYLKRHVDGKCKCYDKL